MLSSSPRHIAASRVLHRLLAPRHPPSALSCLTKKDTHRIATPPKMSASQSMRETRSALDSKPYSIVKDRQKVLATGLSKAGRPRGTQRSPGSHASGRTGGADRDRTDDLRLAKPALSQLSYSPVLPGPPLGFASLRASVLSARRLRHLPPLRAADSLVGLGRFELPTSRLSGGRSNRTELQAPCSRSTGT